MKNHLDAVKKEMDLILAALQNKTTIKNIKKEDVIKSFARCINHIDKLKKEAGQ
jgi:hypothetical protein